MSGDTFEFDDRNHAERFVGTLHDPAATPGDVLTVQADKSIAAQPGGGGSGGVQVVTVPVSSAQILDLANTTVTLIPGVAGNVTVVTAGAFIYVAGLIPYLDGGGGINVDTAIVQNNWLTVNPCAGFWDQSTDQARAVMVTGEPLGDAASPYVGVDVILVADNNPTLGDGTLLVTLSYFLAPTV